MSETVTGAELARLILRPGTTAAEVAAMDLASLTRWVAYQRQKKTRSGAVSPNMTDEQIARAILEYAQSDPSDWPVAPSEATTKRACGPGLLGALGGGIGAIVFGIIGAIVLRSAGCFGEYLVYYAFLAPLSALPGAILGAVLARVVTRRMAGTGRRKPAILPLVAGLAVGFVLAGGYWLWPLADAGELDGLVNQFIPRSADTLLERYQAGQRNFPRWNLRGADLGGADLREVRLLHANLRKADLSKADLFRAHLTGADLSGADLSGADLRWAWLHEANLSKANLLGAKVTQAQLDQAASLEGATMPDGTVHE